MLPALILDASCGGNNARLLVEQGRHRAFTLLTSKSRLIKNAYLTLTAASKLSNPAILLLCFTYCTAFVLSQPSNCTIRWHAMAMVLQMFGPRAHLVYPHVDILGVW